MGNSKGTTINLIRNILKSEMCLEDNRIFYYNQDYVLPEDDGLWVIVAYQGSKLYANRNGNFINAQGVFMEKQNVNTQEQIIVHLMSYNLDALQRKEEVPQALASMYSQNLQSQAVFKIAPIMPIMDRSEIEGGRINYRFDVMVTVMSWYEKIKEANYYTGLETQLTIADGSPKNMEEEFNPSVLPIS